MNVTPKPKSKPQKTFLAVTTITVLALTMVFIVYAALLATYTGPTVTIMEPGGLVEYSLNQTKWVTNDFSINNGTDWWARLTITGSTNQMVDITWILQRDGGAWANVTGGIVTTQNYNLTTGTNTIYATTDGGATGNFNWGTLTKDAGVADPYRVQTRVTG